MLCSIPSNQRFIRMGYNTISIINFEEMQFQMMSSDSWKFRAAVDLQRLEGLTRFIQREVSGSHVNRSCRLFAQIDLGIQLKSPIKPHVLLTCYSTYCYVHSWEKEKRKNEKKKRKKYAIIDTVNVNEISLYTSPHLDVHLIG